MRKDSGGSDGIRKRARAKKPIGTSSATPQRDFHVVGVGASAGGLESLERLFSHLPADTGMAFVVLQHLSPDFKTLMDELLGRRTTMPVRLAHHEVDVEPNTVYLLPPTKEMIIRGKRLLLSDKDPRQGLALPIDVFLRSLAQDAGDRAIAVILSGSGSDGSRGIQDVSRAGGLVFCETSDTAKFTGMPNSALRTGVVDQSLTPEGIAAAIARVAQPSRARDEANPPATRRGVDAVLQLLHEEYGIDFSHYKASTVGRRIERRLSLNHSLDLDAYIEQIRRDPRELNSLYEDLLIGVTRFFRDDDAFAVLTERIVSELVERSAPDEQIRVWVPGCATGQEAYSIAMLLFESLMSKGRSVNVKILASDVHKASLNFASQGLYPAEQVTGISPTRMERFFARKPNGYQISQDLRDLIVFCPHNLLRDAPFTKLDLISCRNLLIYFQPHAQKTVLTLFHFCLKPGGYLFLGSSESPGGLIDEFDTVDEHAKIYKKRRDVALPRDLKLPLARPGAPPRLFPPPQTANANAGLLTLYDRLLEQFMPAGFLMQADGQLVDTFGGAERLLSVKARRPSHNVLEMVPDEMRTLISGALHRLRRDVSPVRFANVRAPGYGTPVELMALPIADMSGTLTHAFIGINADAKRADGATAPAAETASANELAHAHHSALQAELAYTKENLQATIQELETTNEELQATNEELMASNEELQSTNEELHSVNEELYTVNAEYQKKNAELQELNDDIEHLLDRTDVGTMFLDRELCIRKFTPRIADTFDILPQDVGRPLRTFRHRLAYDRLLNDVERVSLEGNTVETQTWDDRGRCYFLRILPYRARRIESRPPAGTDSDRPLASDGVVITLTEISALEQARAKLAELSAIVESSEDAIIGHALDGTVTTWNAGARRLFGFEEAEVVGRHVRDLYPPALRTEVDKAIAKLREGKPLDRLEVIRTVKNGPSTEVSVTFSPIFDAAGRPVGVSAIARDITPLVAARREIAEREERIRLLLDSTAEAIYGIDLSGACTFCNAACARMVGAESPAALVGRQMHPLLHHSQADGTPAPAERSPIFDAMRNRVEVHVDDEVVWRLDGTSFPAEYWAHPIHRDGQVIGAVVTFIDITERKRAEREIQDGVRRREQFLAMLSHELRNPLSAILSAAQLLRMQPLPMPHQDKATHVIARQGWHMGRLLDDLLDVSRITHGRITLHREAVDLRDTSRAAIEAVTPLIEQRGTRLLVSLPDEIVPLDGDPARLIQIQANLLSNAAKYSPPDATVHFTVACDAEDAVITVRDTGRGIAPDIMPRIFDLFVQGDQSIERPEGGLGIGLTLLRALVELHGGDVAAKSDGPGRGSEFVVRLPLSPVRSTAPRDDRARRQRTIKTVVLVEDQNDARQMLRLLLESRSLTVHTAVDGVEGVALIDRVRPDLAIIDLGLPGLDGYSVARRVRERDRHVCLVALTGYGQDTDIRAALDAGFDEHLTKPADPDRLDEVLSGRSTGPGTTLGVSGAVHRPDESGEWSAT